MLGEGFDDIPITVAVKVPFIEHKCVNLGHGNNACSSFCVGQ